ncbi:class I SAM-dependent methyltransferase [Luteimicrobium xylanilyticum]|uniref:Trans-aconitate 2-methyltransferase n=1 Tax=Luteimicrobium xylanilyticum TaxID=1133546 RepID=A0A5P9QC19_9MICO|nr:class I SAM-dependent methyltransferase [Luteimicrobium xylanilyticum]QFU98967.1 Trans-aconitate 2-methyltransferase [Luteimicrobium xylanilyticum]
MAEAYARVLPDASFEASIDLAMIDRFLDEVGSGACVLDAGCGTGRMFSYLVARDPALRIAGADASEGMLAQARVAHPDVPLVVADLGSLPYEDEELDGILAWYSIIHTTPSELVGVLAELGRVLRPGGALLVGHQAGGGQRRESRRAYGHDVELWSYLHDPSAVCDALTAAGFVVDTRLERAPRPSERHSQAFELATRPRAVAVPPA